MTRDDDLFISIFITMIVIILLTEWTNIPYSTFKPT